MPSSGVQTCARSEEHTSELQSHSHLVCRLLLEKNKNESRPDITAAIAQDAAPSGPYVQPRGDPGGPPTRRGAALFPGLPFHSPFFFFKHRGNPKIYSFSPPLPLPA